MFFWGKGEGKVQKVWVGVSFGKISFLFQLITTRALQPEKESCRCQHSVKVIDVVVTR